MELENGFFNFNPKIKLRFFITKHAKEKMIERAVLPPFGQRLDVIGRKLKKKVKQSCKKEGIHRDKIYFKRSCINSETNIREAHVYVCVTKGIGTYIIITCFKYEL